jgi:3-isopropylmalate dehydratase small subunit
MTDPGWRGTAHVYGDNVDTDRIIPGKYTKTLDTSVLAAHVLEDLDPDFRQRVARGDFVVAGENFGCGSSREQAPVALQAAGVRAIIARSFAAIFYRNAINIGLPLLEVPAHAIVGPTTLLVDLSTGAVHDARSDVTYRARPLPPVMVAILEAGGLVPFLARHGDFVLPGTPESA